MKHAPRLAAVLTAVVLALPGAAAADCYADYKAKRDRPLQLHYGVIALPAHACTPATAAPEITRRIGADGWTLLNVMGIFGPEGLAQRQADAGRFFLRY